MNLLDDRITVVDFCVSSMTAMEQQPILVGFFEQSLTLHNSR